jgi:hypothetical protein
LPGRAEPIAMMLDTFGVKPNDGQTKGEQSDGTAVSENDRADAGGRLGNLRIASDSAAQVSRRHARPMPQGIRGAAICISGFYRALASSFKPGKTRYPARHAERVSTTLACHPSRPTCRRLRF